MIGHRRGPRASLGLVLVLSLTLTPAPGPSTVAAVAAAGSDPPGATLPAAALLPGWDGSIDLYRDGVFTTQKSWLWCTAAGVQIVRNIVERDDDHSTSGQRRYFDWMRQRNRYDLPESAGIDPQGWTAGLRHFVDDRYRLVKSRTFSAGLKSAAANLRRTGLPVALTVSHGGHGWILTGFEATADPLLTDKFDVTTVRVVGPLFGRQSKNGYDMRPDTELTIKELRRYFTPWRYAPLAMIWDGMYVSLQPVVQDHEPPVAWAARAATYATDLLAIRAQASWAARRGPNERPGASGAVLPD